jgi:hypothetical protein
MWREMNVTPNEIISNPELFAKYFLKITDKDGNLIPFEWNEIQKDFHSKRTGKDIVLKARQHGMSTYVQGEIFRRLVTKTTRALTLTHDDKTTQILRETADRFYKYFPEFIETDKPKRKYANASLSNFPETDSNHYIGTAGNTDVGRGGSYTDIHLSEVAFFPDAERIVAGAMQGGNPKVILESTANGATGYFYDLCMDSLANRNDWKLHFYPWYSNPEYSVVNNEPIVLTPEEKELAKKYNLTDSQIKWRRSKKVELKRLFPQEYPENVEEAFLLSGKGYFSDIPLGYYNAPLNQLPKAEHRYTGGLDFGQSNDFTCLIVVDRTTREMVDYLHINKLSWNLQRLEIVKMFKKWRLAGLRAEGNSIGSVNIEELEAEGINIEKFDTTNTSKNEIFQRLHEELETGLKLLDWGILKSEMNSLTSKQTKTGLWTISAEGNSHDDTCIALALAVTARISGDRRVRTWK